jgi:hypothetical protein
MEHRATRGTHSARHYRPTRLRNRKWPVGGPSRKQHIPEVYGDLAEWSTLWKPQGTSMIYSLVARRPSLIAQIHLTPSGLNWIRTIYPSPPHRTAVLVLSRRRYSNTQQKRGKTRRKAKQRKRQEDTMASPVCSCCMNGMALPSHPWTRYATPWSGRLS